MPITQPIDMNQKPETIFDSNSKIKENNPEMQEFKMIMQLYETGKQAKSEVCKDWEKRYEYYGGKQWSSTRSKDKSSPVYNIIRSTVQSILPILTDARPGFNVLPQDPTDFDFADTMSKNTESWWDNYSLDQTVIEWIMDSMIYDAGIIKVTWDGELQDGIGDVFVDPIDPRDIYVPPEARDFNKNCPWVIQVMKKSIGELKIKFPQFADKIKADINQEDHKEDIKAASTDITIVSPIDKKGSNNPMPGQSNDDRELVEVLECWLEDLTLEEYEEEKEVKFKKRFPRGKVITILPNQKLVLQSVENPYKHGKFPFVRLVDTLLPRKFWGEGEVKELMGIQDIINRTLSVIMDYTKFMGNPIWKIGKGTGVNPKQLTNTIGLILEINDGKLNEVQREFPQGIPSYIINFLETMIRASETISGAGEITQGRKPTGITAAAAIDTVQEAAQTRIRLKERNLQSSLSQLGKQVISLMMQFYNVPRVARITGKTEWPEFFEFFIEEIPEEDRIKWTKKGYSFDENAKRYVPGEIQEGVSKGVFDVKVLSGTALPFAKAQRSNIAFRLFDSQVIDAQELLNTLEWPNKEQVLKRIEDQKAEAKQLQEEMKATQEELVRAQQGGM